MVLCVCSVAWQVLRLISLIRIICGFACGYGRSLIATTVKEHLLRWVLSVLHWHIVVFLLDLVCFVKNFIKSFEYLIMNELLVQLWFGRWLAIVACLHSLDLLSKILAQSFGQLVLCLRESGLLLVSKGLKVLNLEIASSFGYLLHFKGRWMSCSVVISHGLLSSKGVSTWLHRLG